jgi:ribose transport system substrate-binding protein
MRRNSRWAWLTVIAIGVVSLTAACGGDDGTTSAASVAPAATSASEAPSTEAASSAAATEAATSQATEAATSGATEAATSGATEAATDAVAGITAPTEAGTVKKLAFFGFWKSNSFTQAVAKAVQAETEKLGIEFVDLTGPAYDGPAQVKAMQDQTAKGDAQVYVVLATDPVGAGSAAAEATAKGIKVVAAFTPFGGKFDTLEPQIEGTFVVGETPIANGTVLGELAASACKDRSPCKVAYLQGLKTLPLDNARTDAFKAALAAGAPDAELVAEPEGGYTPETGQKAAQDVVQANPDVNVMVGSSQATLGAAGVVDTGKVALIGNGSSTEAFAGVNDGSWYALYYMDLTGLGTTSVDVGVLAANDLNPPTSFDTQALHDPHGTKDVLADVEGVYSDLG